MSSELASIITDKLIVVPVSLVVDKSIVWEFDDASKVTAIVAFTISKPSFSKSSSIDGCSSDISSPIDIRDPKEPLIIGITHSMTSGDASLV